MSKVVMIKLDHYNPDDLRRTMKAAFRQLDLAKDFLPNEKILIKPNMLAAVAPEKAVTPHPNVFAALAQSLQDCGVELGYGDSPALDAPERAARTCGFEAIAEQMGIAWADFSQAVPKDIPDAKLMRSMSLAKGVAEADGLVSLAKLKTHALTAMTGVIKNQYGVIPGLMKGTLHVNYQRLEDFCQMLIDINLAVKPRLYVLDAIVAMEGNGPKNGKPRPAGLLLLSRDPVAIDAAGATLIGIDQDRLPFLAQGATAGLGENDLSLVDSAVIQISGRSLAISSGRLDQMLQPLKIKGFVAAETEKSSMSRATRIGAPLLKQFVMNRPVIDSLKCTRCGICVKACPVEPKALSQSQEKHVPHYHYRRCIRCYICQETCPTGAISVKKTWFGRHL